MFLSFLQSAISFSTVFLFGSTGETLTEKSGHLNMGIPGTMCVGALGGCMGLEAYIQSLPGGVTTANGFVAVLIGILCSMLAASFMGLIYSFLTVTLRCNQNVTGLTLTTFGVGLTNFMGSRLETEGFSILSNFFKKGFVTGDKLNWFQTLFLSYGCLVYLAIIVALIAAFVLRRTRLGLNLRSVGESPATADAAGINVTGYKYGATVLGSAIAGIGGLYFIMDYLLGSWEYSIDALGWLAVALVIFSVWKPDIGILGAIVFGALYIAPYFLNISFAQQELVKMLPYAVTLLVLIVTSIFNKRETQAPQSLGLPYFREER